jgi:hypothetical protein
VESNRAPSSADFIGRSADVNLKNYKPQAPNPKQVPMNISQAGRELVPPFFDIVISNLFGTCDSVIGISIS